MRHVSSLSCDFSFASIYLWKDFYHLTYAECEGMLFFRSDEERVSFSLPLGEGDPGNAVKALIAYCKEQDLPLVFHSISKEMEAYLNEYFPGKFHVEYIRDAADYIYETQDLIELKGRKYHGKKNHINKFMRMYDWSYEKVSEENLQECLEMLEKWKGENCDPCDLEKHAEICVSKSSLKNREMLGLVGGAIRADGKIVAFAVGEKITEDTFCVHIEKAFADVPGAYSVINQQFLLHEASDLKYVNREDDVGDEGLRQAKLSYHPAFLEEKAVAFYQE
ncbi:MAG: phosphatidylglycerol lysyltransferase domain-containing protein [Clostridiales bacterium]|nr:phosphatidylglycerol lysyltransferase domain-containing protein [Clostridiales bacterium]